MISELVRVQPAAGNVVTLQDWRAGIRRVAPGLEIESMKADLTGEMSRFDFAGAKIWSIRSDTQRMRRIRPALDNRYRPMALIQIQSTQRVTQLGRECELTPGCFTFLDAATPHRIEHDGPFHLLVMEFPRSTFAPSVFHKAVAVRAEAHSAVDQPFFKCVDSLWSAAAFLHPEQHVAALRAVVSLGQLTTPMSSAANADDVPIRVLRAIEYIEQNLGESWLCPQAVADAQGVSRRYLDALFEAKRRRLQGWIWERRLQRAAEELAIDDLSRTNLSRSILQIALDLGFKTPSHFSRAFCRRFGVPPREFRRMAYKQRLAS
jgi:AraC family transcriptional regulator, positive regulator of tynA and feaB